MAASLAIDRHTLHQAELLGFGTLTGSIIPHVFDVALPVEPPPYDPARARKLLAEAGYPGGFDAGEFFPFPPYTSMGDALSSDLGAVGIKTRVRSMERAAFLTATREKKLNGVILVITAASGNAATRLEACVSRGGMYTGGVLPEVEDLFQRQERETDRKKRETMLFQIQKSLVDRVIHRADLRARVRLGSGTTGRRAGGGAHQGLLVLGTFRGPQAEGEMT